MWKVMVADDEAYIRDGLAALISWAEYDCQVVYWAQNGKELVENLERFQPDIVVTDIKMPVMDGLSVAKYVYEHMEYTQVIILTAYTDFEYAQEAIHYDVSDYVIKTAMLEEIPNSLKKAVGNLSKYRKAEEKIPGKTLMPVQKDEPEDILGKVQTYIEQNYTTRITLTDIAEAVHANRSYLSRLYKQRTGNNLFDVINKMKLSTAKEYIENGKKIYEAAEMVGFDDTAYFSRVFKKYEGCSPKEYEFSKRKKQNENQ